MRATQEFDRVEREESADAHGRHRALAEKRGRTARG
jgi:hypothetical protein